MDGNILTGNRLRTGSGWKDFLFNSHCRLLLLESANLSYIARWFEKRGVIYIPPNQGIKQNKPSSLTSVSILLLLFQFRQSFPWNCYSVSILPLMQTAITERWIRGLCGVDFNTVDYTGVTAVCIRGTIEREQQL